MYEIKMNFKLIIAVIIFLSLLYGGQLFIISTHQTIYEENITKFQYILPIIIIGFFAISIYLTMNTSELIYSYIYLIFGLYLGYPVKIYNVSITREVLNIF